MDSWLLDLAKILAGMLGAGGIIGLAKLFRQGHAADKNFLLKLLRDERSNNLRLTKQIGTLQEMMDAKRERQIELEAKIIRLEGQVDE